MDSLTQLTLGAAVGGAYLGRSAGNRAIFWGTALGTLPDLDVLARPFLDIISFTEFHRGLTHSFAFMIPASFLLGKGFRSIYEKLNISASKWTIYTFLILFTHVLLDCFTTWGTQVLWPFPYRVAWETIFVIDPAYTIPLLLFVILSLIARSKKVKMVRVGLIISTAYLAWTVVNKSFVTSEFQNTMAEQGMEIKELRTKPTPLNNFLWSGLAKTENGFLIGYYSLLQPEDHPELRHIPQQRGLLAPVKEFENIQDLLRITQGYYALEEKDEELILHDLRFGEMYFWDPSRVSPVFSYSIIPQKSGPPLIERKENSLELGKKMFQEFLHSIQGKDPK